MELERSVGLRPDGAVWLPEPRTAIRSILLKLAAMGVTMPADTGDRDVLDLGHDLFARYREQSRLLSEHLCPTDRRIQNYIDGLLSAAGFAEPVRLPGETLILDHYGLARELSLPMGADAWHNELVSSHRLDNGVLHNPVNDRRTTQGVFHVSEGGLPIPADKVRVPLGAYLRLLQEALRPPAQLLRLPFTANWPEPVETMVSLLLRPLVCPAVPRVTPEKRMEVRFFVPGGLVSNLDFVESIFGNAGDPYLPGNDAALDVDGWTGHSGCVILAPAPHAPPQEGPRPAAREPGHRGRAGRGHVLGGRERAVQRRPAVQDHLARHGGRDGDDPGRQLLRLLQEGGQDPDRL